MKVSLRRRSASSRYWAEITVKDLAPFTAELKKVLILGAGGRGEAQVENRFVIRSMFILAVVDIVALFTHQSHQKISSTSFFIHTRAIKSRKQNQQANVAKEARRCWCTSRDSADRSVRGYCG